MFSRWRQLYHEFPRLFWIIVVVRFIDGVGGTLLWPFFALYITKKFNVGMTEAGVMLGMSSLFGLVGSMIGGALADRFGRKQLILFGLVFSALSSLSLGLVSELAVLYPLIVLVGLLSSVAHPAHEAMIADILPREKRQEGFGILRVVANFSWIIGPTVGGFLANINFFYLFVIDAVVSCLAAVIIARAIPETKPAPHAHAAREPFLKTLAGYRFVLRDTPFVSFIAANIIMIMVYQQMYGTLSVFLRDYRGISTQGYGLIMSTSAVTVVLFQIWLSRRIRHRPPFLMMAAGAVFYAVGFSLFGVFTTLALFALNSFIITIGEMIVIPTGQSLIAGFAPGDMRGRYMAISGLAWAIPSTFGPGLAGYIMDHYNPNLVWYLGGVFCGISMLAFCLLHLRLGARPQFAFAKAPDGPAGAPA